MKWINEGSLNSRQIIREMAGIDKENKISQIKNHVSKVKDSKATKKIVGVAKKAKDSKLVGKVKDVAKKAKNKVNTKK